MNIAIDGPAGAGKSTIAKMVAKELNYIYVDTGAMFRSMALYFIRNDISLTNEQQIKKACEDISIEIRYENEEQQIYLNGENVNEFIRKEEIGKGASQIAVYGAVRTKLLELQRKIAANENVIMDGRDIGTAVLPNAETKIYLTASSKERAKRRVDQLKEKGVEARIEEIEADIIKRDEQDMNREIAPLKQAKDATLIDSSNMTIDQVVQEIINCHKNNIRE